MKVLKKIYKYLTSRYSKVQLLVIIAVLVFAFIITDSNIFARLGYDSKIRELDGQIDYYKEQIVLDKKKLEQLQSNKDDIEKFARENYLMKKADEDIFIVE